MRELFVAPPSSVERRGRSAVDGTDLVRVVSAVVLCVMFPWLLIVDTELGDRGSSWLVYLGIAVWSGWRLAGIIASGVATLYAFFFWLFCYLFCGVAAMVQFRTGETATLTPRLTTDNDMATALVTVLGIVAFEVGTFFARTRATSRSIAAPAPAPGAPPVGIHEPRQRDSNFRSIAMLAITVPIFVFYVSRVSIGRFFTSREQLSIASNAAFPDATFGTIVSALSWVPALVVLHRIVGPWFRSRRSGYRLTGPETAAVAVAIVMISVANNPLTSSRYGAGSMLLSFVMLFGGFNSPTRTRRALILVVVGFIVLYPVADTFRRDARASIEFSLLDEYPGNPDYDAIAQLHNAVTVVENEGFGWLRQPSGAALFWVPRSIWSSKPVDTGIYLAEARNYGFTNLSAPLWAELYIIAGPATVVLGFVALGYAFVRLDRRLNRSLRGAAGYPVVGSFVPPYLLIILRGSLLQAMALLATFLISVYITRTVRRTDASAAPQPTEDLELDRTDAILRNLEANVPDLPQRSWPDTFAPDRR